MANNNNPVIDAQAYADAHLFREEQKLLGACLFSFPKSILIRIQAVVLPLVVSSNSLPSLIHFPGNEADVFCSVVDLGAAYHSDVPTAALIQQVGQMLRQRDLHLKAPELLKTNNAEKYNLLLLS